MGRPIPVLFGTETGNAEECARQLVKALVKRGVAARLFDMDDYRKDELPGESLLLVITSTFGNGDAPANAHDTLEWLRSDGAPRLEALRYAVCGLGDSSYPNFAQAGKNFDAALERLGAKRVFPRQDCDVDYEEPFRAFRGQVLEWVEAHVDELEPAPTSTRGGGLFGWLKSLFGGGGTAEIVAEEPAPSAPRKRLWSKDHPFEAELLVRKRLNGPGSTKETMHYELSLEGSEFVFHPGDSFALVPRNCPDAVAGVIEALGLPPDVEVDGKPLAERLAGLCLKRLSHDLVAAIAPSLPALASDDALRQHLADRDLRDLLDEHPGCGLDAGELLALLKPLQPRLYSVASSAHLHPDRLHLTVETVRFELEGRARKGVASTWLCDRVEVGDRIGVYLVPNRGFRLPDNPDLPLILIGPGTGIAPFRAFLQEREATGAKGKAWLFFGHRNHAADFLYGDELRGFVHRGVLTRLDCAWSRDQEHKVYVQHKLLDHAAEVYTWLRDGAHVYVCGDAAAMAPDVHEALIRVVEQGGDVPREDAEAFIERLRGDRRYKRDVY